MGTFIFKRKYFSSLDYDDTDRLKQMKDSDILAEKEQKKPGVGGALKTVGVTALGAGAGMVAGRALDAGTQAVGMIRKKVPVNMNNFNLNRVNRAGKIGALAVGTTLAVKSMKDNREKRKTAEAYNDRLEYAQRQARRREKIDWKQNMTQRDGYSY